jgi:hypothetical protein
MKTKRTRRPKSSSTQKRKAKPRRARPQLADEDLATALKSFETMPIPALPASVREYEIQRRLLQHFDAIEETLRFAADVGMRTPRLIALNVIAALRLALDPDVSYAAVQAHLDAVDHEVCRFINDLGGLVPAPSEQGRLRRENRLSGDKCLLLDRIHFALEYAQVPKELRRDRRVEWRHIEAQWKNLDQEEPKDKAWTVAAHALSAPDNLLLRELARPMTADPAALDRDHRALARAIRLLIDHGIASEQNVALVTLHYFGMPSKLRKNFFKGIEDEWKEKHEAFWSKHGDLIMRTSRDG